MEPALKGQESDVSARDATARVSSVGLDMGVQCLPENIPAQISDETLGVVPADSKLAIPCDHLTQ
jgi:hypothetical protein